MTQYDGGNQLNELLLAHPTRRELIKRLSVLAFCAGSELALPAFGQEAPPAGVDLSSSEKTNLLHYAHLIVPLLERSHPRYQQVAERIALIAKHDGNMAGFITGGIAELDNHNGSRWAALRTEKKIERLKNLQGSPFFGFLRWFTSETILRDPALWEKLGYEGSSLEHGGYLHRGFDDIDWLPNPDERKAKEGSAS